MMEKYGTDPSAISPTDDQIRTIKRLSKQAGEDFTKLRYESAEEAENIIEELEKKAGAL